MLNTTSKRAKIQRPSGKIYAYQNGHHTFRHPDKSTPKSDVLRRRFGITFGHLILIFTNIWLPVSKHMTSSPPAKKACIEMKIGTHNGSFHCDEVLACFLLKQLPTYKDAEIIRTRDQKVLDTCDIVVDVGGIFDPSKNRFDHHQK
ncbi:Hypothetical predicted protein [Mytilus galloprovincialis]|uniref:Uncharacterized protein n=1 Tax=Mytilus galloprovincialis TaxID=29158 RepID=A0A8B6BQU5_MYTGA|nr:Hypothetical predicted protein [Mytilus galloprovincialis]